MVNQSYFDKTDGNKPEKYKNAKKTNGLAHQRR
jgi:hypothetical protein